MSEPRSWLESTWAKSIATNSTYLPTPASLGPPWSKGHVLLLYNHHHQHEFLLRPQHPQHPHFLRPYHLPLPSNSIELWPHQVENFSLLTSTNILGFPRWVSGKESTCHCRRGKRCGFNPWAEKIPWRRTRQPFPVFLPGESYGQKDPAGCSLWICTDWSDCTHMHRHTSVFKKQVWQHNCIPAGNQP